MKPIVLIGMMGAGKTTVGKRLASSLGREFIDSDHEIEVRCGAPVATVFELEGEPSFRKREAEVISELLNRENIVLSTGGGCIVTESTREVLKTAAVTVYLRAHIQDLWNRTRRDRRRPLLQTADPKARLTELYDARKSFYEACSHIQIETGRQPVEEVVRRVLSSLQHFEQAHVKGVTQNHA